MGLNRKPAEVECLHPITTTMAAVNVNNKRPLSATTSDLKGIAAKPVALLQQTSTLAKLPHELLVSIMSSLLVNKQPLELHSKRRFVRSKTSRGSVNAASWSTLMSVLLASRSLYFAAIEVYYGQNELRFHQAIHLRTFVSGLSYDQRWAIHEITVEIQWIKARRSTVWAPLHESDYCGEWAHLLNELPKLRNVNIVSYCKSDEVSMRADVSVAQKQTFEDRMRMEAGTNAAKLLFVWQSVA